MNQDHIRNFAIIAHIDHGKSTLADRLLELTGTVADRDMSDQLLDSNPIERERGITIKLAPVRMKYRFSNMDFRFLNNSKIQNPKSKIENEFILNLIDTPGHVDFSYEVSRSLQACEGAILVVDATQGVQAQTLANLHQARNHKLVVIPVINKIDLPNARKEETVAELLSLGFNEEEMIFISAKTGEHVEAVLQAIVERIPSPKGQPEAPTRGLVFSSQYDSHKGVVVFVRIVDGTLLFSSTLHLRFMQTGAEVTPIEVGYFMPKMMVTSELHTGEVGYIATGLKDIRFAKVGDTITVKSEKLIVKSVEKDSRDLQPTTYPLRVPPAKPLATHGRSDSEASNLQPLPGYQEPKPMVFLGLFPISADEFQDAREAMEKLRLSDSAFTFRPITSTALGNGFHCGFLGLLHAEVVQERLFREFGLTLLATAPSVEYRIQLKSGVNPSRAGIKQLTAVNGRQQSTTDPSTSSGSRASSRDNLEPNSYFSITSAAEFPDPSFIEEVREPIMQLSVFSPQKYVGAIMALSQEKRGEYIDLTYIGNASLGMMQEDSARLAKFTYLMPLSEMIVDFFDRLKSATEGYASLDYEFFDYQKVEVVKLDILVNKEKVDAFASLVVESQAQMRGRDITERLSEVIPKQQFEIPIQAAIGGQVIARADVKAFRKDVIAKLYGGDRTRKDKLLNKQKKGKARMKLVGRVEIPQAAFFAVLKRE